MGKAKLQAELGLSTKAEAENLFNQYHEMYLLLEN
jgi:hypothetical protein